MRYEPKAVTHSSLSEVSTGSMDKGSIYVAILADGPQESYGGESYPFVIKTKRRNADFLTVMIRV